MKRLAGAMAWLVAACATPDPSCGRLLVAHGANDPRVPAAEAEQVVQAVRAAGREAWLFLAPDEGHGFKKRRSRDLFYRTMAEFFERHLVDEPVGEPESTVEPAPVVDPPPEDEPEPPAATSPDEPLE